MNRHPHNHAERVQGGDIRTDTPGRHTQVDTNEAETRREGTLRHRGDRKEEREKMGWDVRLFANRMERFPAKLLIQVLKGREMRKVKCFCNRSEEEAQTEFVLLDIPL